MLRGSFYVGSLVAALSCACGGSSDAPGDTDQGASTSTGADEAGPTSAGPGTVADDSTSGGTGSASATEGNDDPTDGADTAEPAWGEHCPGEPAFELGTPVFVGGGGVDGRVSVTLDGESWADATTASLGPVARGHTRNLIRGVGYGGGTFVVVGGFDNGYISISCDGVTWDRDVLGTNIEGEVPAPFTDFLSDVAFSDGIFVAAGGAGARLTSTDMGLTWQPTGEWVEGHFRGIASGGGRFVATGHTWRTAAGISTTSVDGVNWTPVVSGGGELGGVVFGADTFVASGGGRCARSSDGESWTDCGLPAMPDAIIGVHFAAGVFYLQFINGQFTTSPDAVAWTPLQEGWLPDTFAFGADRFVMGRYGARGWATTFGEWSESAFDPEEGLTRIVFGTVGG